MRSGWRGYAFIAPWLIGFLAFTAWPFVASLWLSFCRYDVITPPRWIGGGNYRALAADALFWRSLVNTIAYAAVAVPLSIATAFGLALLLNLPVRGLGLYRTLFVLPHIVPVVATSVVFMWVLNPQIGLVNAVLRQVGIVGPAWLQDPRWAMPTLVLMSFWGIGGALITYLAGLKDIPVALYEAARIDGANALQRARHITLPLMTPVIFFNLVMGIIGGFQYFTQAYVMTQGGPEDSTLFYALYLFYRAWRYLDMGYASAMAWVLFVVVVTVTGALFATQRRWVHYDD
ncbi:MAG TPA: sugar ABC transporter permease [Planctomycetota bacterium]|nr:sugar ABC transporter permease [Planctomycetota bacterium]